MDSVANQFDIYQVELLNWHRPEVKRLVLVSTTGLRGSSIEDQDDLGPVFPDVIG